MLFKNELLKRLSFRIDYKKPDEIKIAIAYFSLVFVFLRFIAIGLEQTEFFALILTVGALVYLLGAVYFIHKLFQPSFKKYLRYYHFCWSLVYAIILMWAVYLMFAPITITSENTIFSFIISLLFIILPASFSDEIINSLKKTLAPALFFIPTMPNLTDSNNSNISNLISGKLPNLTSPFPYLDILNSIVTKFGFPIVIVVVIVALFMLKTIKTLLQLSLIAIIIWAIVKYFGIL